MSTSKALPVGRPVTLDLSEIPHNVAAAYVAAFAVSRHPTPIHLHVRAGTLAALAEELISRGRVLRDVDTDGVSLSWPLSQRPFTGTPVESTVMWLTLTGPHHAAYIPAGHPRGHSPFHLRRGTLPELLDLLTSLEDPEPA